MNVFTLGHRHQPWVWQVTGLCFVLGVLLAGSLQTVSSIRRSGAEGGRIGFSPIPSSARQDTIRELQKEIGKLQKSKTDLEDTLASGSNKAKTLNESLQEAKQLAGLTPVTGPGLVIELRDSTLRAPSNRVWDQERFIIHDVDLQQVVNEVLAAGAEAVALNDQRYTARTAIRCVGPVIQVNGTPISMPFRVQVIGDPKLLGAALSLPGGLLDGLRWVDKQMCKVEKRQRLHLPGYAGSTATRYARSPDEVSSAAVKGSSGR